MSFVEHLRAARPSEKSARSKRWIYVPYDQLTASHGPLSRCDPRETGVLFIESAHKPSRRDYHKKKLALLLSNQRHFALELAERGFSLLFCAGEESFAPQMRAAIDRYGLGALTMMRAAERELREELAAIPELRVERNELWLTDERDFERTFPKGPPYRMDAFYREVRRAQGVLMDARNKPIGGQFSFDGDNRNPWKGAPAAPKVPRFEPDAITREVLALVERRFGDHWGSLDDFALPCSSADAARSLAYVREVLPSFGAFEDAMNDREPALFHTLLSALINLGRVHPRAVIALALEELAAERAPLESVEGLIRQVLGWREFVRHVHERTDGFRTIHRDAAPSALDAHEPLPPVFWGERPSGLRCLDSVIEDVRSTGYSHHITRLMVLSNIATLLGVEPRALTDWFWAAYTDAFDWVVEPNVLAMGTFGAGPVMTTKPYVAGAAYVQKMSNYCGGCRFDPKAKDPARACPLTPMYWAFLDRNLERLEAIDRVGPVLATVRKRTDAQKTHAAAVLERVRGGLARGEALPADVVNPRKAQ